MADIQVDLTILPIAKPKCTSQYYKIFSWFASVQLKLVFVTSIKTLQNSTLESLKGERSLIITTPLPGKPSLWITTPFTGQVLISSVLRRFCLHFLRENTVPYL